MRLNDSIKPEDRKDSWLYISSIRINILSLLIWRLDSKFKTLSSHVHWENLYHKEIVANEKYFPLVDKESGMVTIYNQNWDRPDFPVAQYDPKTKKIVTNPLAPK